MPNFRDILGDGRLYFFDGGYGTLLQSRGMPPGLSPEMFGLKNPEVVRRVHEEYLEAGADVLTTNTFGGTRHKLGPGAEVTAINRELAALARRAAGDRAFVAGSVGPSGHFVEPLGELTLADLVQAFKEQITGLVQGGVDLILAETHFDLAEAKAVVLAAREVCDLPVAVSMTFEAEKSLTGTPPLTFVDTMQNLGVEVVATNCGAGPEQILAAVRAMLPRLETPLLVEPNAGLPELDERGRTVFRLGPGPFAQASRKFAALGAKFVGGCCGTTPEHIRALRKACQGQSAPRPGPGPGCLVLTSRSASAAVGFGHPAALIGERINPTGKKALAQDLAQGRLGAAQDLAQEQIDAGAPILDVNVGAAMVDEQKVLPELVKALSARFQVPLSIDSADARAVEAALWVSAASPLVNSISGEPGRMEVLGPLCARFGAPFILLPIPGKDLPLTASERLAVIERLLGRALDLGVPKRLVLVDALALTVSSKPEAARHCLETIRLCRENLGLPCVVGLSNISFGLPARELLNSAFLSMARGQGLCALIANPGSARVREALAASEVLMDRDPQAARFIAAFSGWRPGGGPGPAAGPAAPGPKKARGLYEAVVQGAKDVILDLVEEELARGAAPMSLVDEKLIPAIMEVGERYERKEYFLPQLLLSAETLQTAFGRLRPLMEEEAGAETRPVAVMATVEGDIHDIGKNIVCLMLRNQGFEVLDLGKDVPAGEIVAAAVEKKARVIGLSALMTTTMVRMRDTVDLLREKGLDIKVMIGGAVVTEAFAQAIGADGCATDAVAAVRLAKRLVQ